MASLAELEALARLAKSRIRSAERALHEARVLTAQLLDGVLDRRNDPDTSDQEAHDGSQETRRSPAHA